MLKIMLSIVFALCITYVANAKSKVQSKFDVGYDNPTQIVCN